MFEILNNIRTDSINVDKSPKLRYIVQTTTVPRAGTSPAVSRLNLWLRITIIVMHDIYR